MVRNFEWKWKYKEILNWTEVISFVCLLVFFSVKQPTWCMPCTDEITNYCLGGKMLDDHCCCESRHGKGSTDLQFLFFYSIVKEFNEEFIHTPTVLLLLLLPLCAIVCAFPLRWVSHCPQTVIASRSVQHLLFWIKKEKKIIPTAFSPIRFQSNRKKWKHCSEY